MDYVCSGPGGSLFGRGFDSRHLHKSSLTRRALFLIERDYASRLILALFTSSLRTMITEISFTKASGAGNDFVIIDNRRSVLAGDTTGLAQQLCSRNFGIGADGLLLVETSQSADFAMRYYNSDGSYGGMCGNGGRCLARFAFLNGIAPAVMTFESLEFIYQAEVKDSTVVLRMKDPTAFRIESNLPADELLRGSFFIDTGSPHVVCFVDDIERVPVAKLGRMIREAPALLPGGANVDFVSVGRDNSIKLRTYERGVEGETLACGTGAVASGVVAHLQKGLRFPVVVHVRSGESLLVNAIMEGGSIKSPSLEGSAHILFNGKIRYDSASRSIAEPTQGLGVA